MTNKPDYLFKAKVLKSDLPRYVNIIEHTLYARDMLSLTGEVINTKISYDTALDLRGFLIENYPLEYAEAEKLNKAYYKRVKRLRVRVHDILSNYDNATFLTLTFNDKSLNNTTRETRKRYVDRYLKSQGSVYVANIDYGKTNGREHYHAVINARCDLSAWQKYGFASAEKVVTSTDRVPAIFKNLSEEDKRLKLLEINEKRLSKYVSKLSNHAIKETTKRSHLIYSKSGAILKSQYLPHVKSKKRICDEWLSNIANETL